MKGNEGPRDQNERDIKAQKAKMKGNEGPKGQNQGNEGPEANMI